MNRNSSIFLLQIAKVFGDPTLLLGITVARQLVSYTRFTHLLIVQRYGLETSFKNISRLESNNLNI